MCILCVASRWSRHIAAMVMPMVTLWAISQFLPQGFRFEINSPKLACVGVLFVSLSWVEIVTPRLSAWRSRRMSAQKEKKRLEAQEAAKRRKKATRRCRNCFTAYKEQAPASGRFTCTFCGHVSKRPVLDPPAGASKSTNSFSFSGSAAEFLSGSVFLSVSPKDWCDRALLVRPSWGSSRSWIGVGPWIDGASWGVTSSWFGSSWPVSGLYLGNTAFCLPESAGNLLGDGVSGLERWFAGDSNCGVVYIVFRVFSQLLVFALWFWRKLWGTECVEENGNNGDCEEFNLEDVRRGSYEPKDKKARKAEEKRLVRLQKEYQEAEEKKQREEVAQLVEERRRRRAKKFGLDEMTDTDANKGKVIDLEGKSERSHKNTRDMEKVSCAKENDNDKDSEKSTKKANFAPPKHAKPAKTIGGECKEENIKAAPTFFSRWSAFKSRGSAEKRPFSSSKYTAVVQKKSSNLLPVAPSPLRPCLAPGATAGLSPSAANSSIKASECGVNDKGRTPKPWVKVLTHGALDVSAIESEDTDIMQSILQEPSTDMKDSNSRAAVDQNLRAAVDQSLSNVMASNSGHTENAAPLFEDAQDHHSVGEKLLLVVDPIAGQETEITSYNVRSNDDVDAHTKSLLLNRNDFSQPSGLTASPASQGISQINIFDDSLGKSQSQPGHCDFAATQLHDSILVRPTESSAMLMCENQVSLVSDLDCLPASPNDFGAFPKDWHNGGLMGSSKMITLPVDASLQHRDDLDQEIQFDPDFYLPSNLFTVEEGDNCQCCEDNLPRNRSCWNSGRIEAAVCSWEDFDIHHKVPAEFVDCITHSLMHDPVITADGHSYERCSIAEWLKSHDTSPKTGETLPSLPGGKGVDKTLRPNHILHCQIVEFKERMLQRYAPMAGMGLSI